MNGTVFANSQAGNKGGAVTLSSGDHPWTVAFYSCGGENSSVGLDFEDDPQGEGGGFSVGEGVTLLLSDCFLNNNSCGKKDRLVVYWLANCVRGEN